MPTLVASQGSLAPVAMRIPGWRPYARAVIEPESGGDPAEEDASLVRAIASGDQQALGVLYDRYGRLAYSIAFRVTGDAHAAEECTQDVFMAVWRRASSFDPARARASTWLFAMARNRAIDAVRAGARRPIPHETLPEVGMAPDTAHVVADADRAVHIATAMAALPAPQFEVVQLGYFDGLSHAEIALRLGLPIGTVKGRMRLALGRMREVAETMGLEA